MQIINSEVGFEWAERHKELITKNNINIYAAAYCKDINKEGKQVGFIHTHLRRIYSIVDKIFTDNQNIINSLTKEYGFSPEKFKVHYQPVDKTKSSWQINKKQKNRFLWAGRISLQKRPDLIIGIAKKLKIVNPAAIIEAYGTVGAHYHNVIAEAKLENLKYKGDFDGFYNLNLNDYSAFIYTSDYDGVPNILLEAMNIGIPIIASDVGGVSEVIKDGINGYLVNHNDANTFVETIKNLQLLKPAEIKKFSNESKKILDLQHNNDKYKQILKEDIRL